MAYKIIFTPAANKQLDRLPVNVRVVLKRSIDAWRIIHDRTARKNLLVASANIVSARAIVA
jgi:mRNA-degrading endonuclease RelE of RelBE toxin-antitoxin system